MSKKAKDAAKEPGKTVHNATDGKGLLGFGQNAAKGAREKMTGEHTSESLQNQSQSNLANSNSGRNEAKDPRGAAKSQSGNLRSKNSAAASRMPGGSSSKHVPQRSQSVPLNSGVRKVRDSVTDRKNLKR